MLPETSSDSLVSPHVWPVWMGKLFVSLTVVTVCLWISVMCSNTKYCKHELPLSICFSKMENTRIPKLQDFPLEIHSSRKV